MIAALRSCTSRCFRRLIAFAIMAMVSMPVCSFNNVASATASHAAVNVQSRANIHITALLKINSLRHGYKLSAASSTNVYTTQILRSLLSNSDPAFAPAVTGVVEEFSLQGEMPLAPGRDDVQTVNLLVAAWVNHDGWGGNVQSTWNIDCKSKSSPDCNGHRRALLSEPPVPGSLLTVDVATRSIKMSGLPAVAVGVLMIWRTPAAK